MYMRLMGYPAERISILAAYQGQRHLIGDVLRRRCQDNPLIGLPGALSTVDKYQGQQNDYVLLSLVRTHTVGYLRYVFVGAPIFCRTIIACLCAGLFWE